jgi:uncharacterized SAM-binding protein YcdF (DUF218 family)
MSILLGYLLSVGGFALLAACAVVGMIVRPGSRAARRAVIAIVFLYTAASIRVVPWTLSQPLLLGFHEFRRSDAPGRTVAIVVLGAASFTVHVRHQRLGVLDQDSAARVLEAAHLFRQFDSAWIISSGGPAQGFDIEPSSVTMRDGLVKLGIPPDRILLESESMNTHDEAVLVAPIIERLRPDSVLLVTADIHMRRAQAAFRAAGLDVVPAPSRDPLNSQSRLRSFVPTTDGLRFTSGVAHEYVGLVEYAARGWLRF